MKKDARIDVRPVHLDERAEWQTLWRGYLDFYQTSLPQQTYDKTWARLHDPNEPMWLLGAYIGGKLLGIVHYIYHRSCWTVGDYCYLQDLFTSAAARGKGVGRALINGVYERAAQAGCSRVYWQTHETNHTAMQLYDKVAERPGFVIYRRML